MHSGLREGPC